MAGTGTSTTSITSSINPSSYSQGVVWTASVTGRATIQNQILLQNNSSSEFYSVVGVASFGRTSEFVGQLGYELLIATVAQTQYATVGLTPTSLLNSANAYWGFLTKINSHTGEMGLFEAVDTTATAVKLGVRVNTSQKIVVYNSAGTAVATGATTLALGTAYTIGVAIGTGASAAWRVSINGTDEVTGTTDNLGTVNNGLGLFGSMTISTTQNVDYKAIAVSYDAPPLLSPAGTVQFKVDGSNYGAAVTLSSGVANSTANSTLTAGSHSVSASYNGDSNFATSSATMTQSLATSIVQLTEDVGLGASTAPTGCIVGGSQHNTTVPALTNAQTVATQSDLAGSVFVNMTGRLNSYSAALGASSFAASATDAFTFYGSASKTIKILRITLTGVATTATNQLVVLYKRSTAETGGTIAQSTGGTLHDSNNAASTATLAQYSANPTTVGTSVGILRETYLNFSPTAGGVTFDPSIEPLVWDFTLHGTQPITLRGTGQGVAVNFNGVSLPSGVTLTCEVTWTEDDS